MNLADIQRLFAYTEWANALAVEAAANLPDEELRRDQRISHGSILGTLLHMAGVEWIWLERWQGREERSRRQIAGKQPPSPLTVDP